MNVTVKLIRWQISVNHNEIISTKNGAGGDQITATVTALDSTTGKPVNGVSLTVNDSVDTAKYAQVDASTKSTDAATGTVQFTLTSKPGQHVGLLGGIFEWIFTDAAEAQLADNHSGWDVVDHIYITVIN